jgi:predicted DsbA family dithiol-disulfide isomerase
MERAAWLERRFGATVEWLAFDLHPEYPPQGIPRADLVARYGERAMQSTAAMFGEAGFPYNPNPDVVPNSRRALELAEAARSVGLHAPFHARAMEAYWDEAQDLSDPEVLRALAAEVGLEEALVDEALEERAFAPAVDGATRAAHQAGINAVPAFVVDRRVLVLGAQPHEVLEAAVEQAAEVGPEDDDEEA